MNDQSRRRIALSGAATLLAVAATPALAQMVRLFPPRTRVGVFELGQYPEAFIDGRAVRLNAGASIRDAQNLIVVPNMVSGRHRVRYVLDPQGQVAGVWILTEAEIEEARRQPREAQPAAVPVSPLDTPRN
jgi:hypothetical protein